MLSESDFKHVGNQVRVVGILDDISLKATDGDEESFEHKVSSLRVATLQMLCLEN